jgi:hypothetical protein
MTKKRAKKVTTNGSVSSRSDERPIQVRGSRISQIRAEDSSQLPERSRQRLGFVTSHDHVQRQRLESAERNHVNLSRCESLQARADDGDAIASSGDAAELRALRLDFFDDERFETQGAALFQQVRAQSRCFGTRRGHDGYVSQVLETHVLFCGERVRIWHGEHGRVAQESMRLESRVRCEQVQERHVRAMLQEGVHAVTRATLDQAQLRVRVTL